MADALHELKSEPIDDTLAEPQFIVNLLGMIRTVDAIPTVAPNRLLDQFVYFDNGVSHVLCFYDTTNNRWVSFSGTPL